MCEKEWKKTTIHPFLVANYERFCPSIRPSVRDPWVKRSVTVIADIETSRLLFLVADMQLYKRLCPSVRWSVRQHESKSGKMSIFENFLRMFECEWGNGGWTPLPTRPQRYCDPASLVLLLFFLLLSSILSFCLILSLFPLIDSSPEISSFFFSKFPFCEQD